MSKYYIAIPMLLLLGIAMIAGSRWQLDSAHSSIGFEVNHIVVFGQPVEEEENVTMGVTAGQFCDFNVNFVKGAADFSGSKLDVVIQVSSIDTDNAPRDAHLRSSDFFNAEQYPEIRFKSKTFAPIGDNHYKIVGDLTVRGVTKEIEMAARTNGVYENEAGQRYVSFSANSSINRLDFDLKWSKMLESGAFRVSNYVNLKIQANFVEGN